RAAADRRRDTVTRAIADVDLTGHTDALAGNLSGGQRSRVSLAVALLGTPELLVLDEPTVGLDPVLRRDLWELFHGIAAERNASLLISSHVMDEAERCHSLLLMRAGALLTGDTARPEDAAVTPDALRSRTGAATVERAFLHLVDQAAAAGGSKETTRWPRPPAPARPAPRPRPAPSTRPAPSPPPAGSCASCATTPAPSRCCSSCPA